MMRFALADQPIDIASLRDRVINDASGAFVSFEGWVRNHHAGRAVLGLHYDAYRALAEKAGEDILAQSLQKFAITKAICVHRLGTLAIGELAVYVAVSAAHRDAAFAACRFIIDAVKADVPIWKRERYADQAEQWL
jgi:molybdopterin synthase catalytic subunit